MLVAGIVRGKNHPSRSCNRKQGEQQERNPTITQGKPPEAQDSTGSQDG
jgi:hypothetical protein